MCHILYKKTKFSAFNRKKYEARWWDVKNGESMSY